MEKIHLDRDKQLSLTNDGALDVFFTGVGSAFATMHHNTNYILVKGDYHLAVDMGRNWPEALAANARLSMGDIKGVFISHSHPDHANGMADWLMWHRYVLSMGQPDKAVKTDVIITDEYRHYLWEHTLRGGLEWNEFNEDTGRRLGFGDYAEFVRPVWMPGKERESFEISYPESEPDPAKRIHLEIFRTNHIPDCKPHWADCFTSYGMMVDGHVFISIDTKFDRELVDLYADRSSVMFHDVQFFPGAVHAPLADLHTLPDDVKAKMILMHIGDNWEDQDITGFDGFAEEGLTYRFD